MGQSQSSSFADDSSGETYRGPIPEISIGNLNCMNVKHTFDPNDTRFSDPFLSGSPKKKDVKFAQNVDPVSS